MRRRRWHVMNLVSAGLLAMGMMGNQVHAEAGWAAGAPSRGPRAVVQASHDAFPDHAEPALAVNPRDPRNLLGAAMYFANGPTPGTFASFDGGHTWRDNGALPLPVGASGGADVSAAFDARGAGFVAAGSITDDPNDRGVYVWRTDDGGRSFHRPVAAASRQYVDHPWMAIDPAFGPAGANLYVVWVTRRAAEGGSREGVGFSRSDDGGRTFSPPRLISTPPGGATAPVVAAGPRGAVYVAYVTATTGATPALEVEVIASADHGRAFGSPIVVGHTIFGLAPQPDLILPSGPMIAADPRNGMVYVTYERDRPGGPGQQAADLVLARSRDYGRTWSVTTLVTAASLTANAVVFQPSVAVTEAGTVAVSYLRFARAGVDVFLTQSVTHGARFSRPLRLTSSSFDPALGLPGDKEGRWWIGDYQALAAGPRSIYPCWGDTRTGHLQIVCADDPA